MSLINKDELEKFIIDFENKYNPVERKLLIDLIGERLMEDRSTRKQKELTGNVFQDVKKSFSLFK